MYTKLLRTLGIVAFACSILNSPHALSITLQESLDNSDLLVRNSEGKRSLLIKSNLEKYETQSDGTIRTRDRSYAAQLVSGDKTDVLTVVRASPTNPSDAEIRRVAFDKNGDQTGNFTHCDLSGDSATIGQWAGLTNASCRMMNADRCAKLKKAIGANVTKPVRECVSMLEEVTRALPSMDATDSRYKSELDREVTKARDFYANKIGKSAWQITTQQLVSEAAKRRDAFLTSAFGVVGEANSYARVCEFMGFDLKPEVLPTPQPAGFSNTHRSDSAQ